ncbi:hypothetical protein LB505_001628 [Fusarium chuoi]|nr:hypothetical protein LB505_001628 [Fusarium chuoi]
MLAKTQGVNKLIVAVNKMDDPTVEWSHERYQECTTKLAQFLKGTGYNLKTDVYFLPIAAQQMMGIKTRIPKDVAPWPSNARSTPLSCYPSTASTVILVRWWKARLRLVLSRRV